MHNLHTNYLKILGIAKQVFADQVCEKGNFFTYPHAPKLSDIEVISLAITAEALSIDSENLLFHKLQAEYRQHFPLLPDRSNFNRRRRRLQGSIGRLSVLIANLIPNPSGRFVLDSIPLPICQPGRNARSRICRDDAQCQPSFGYHAAHKQTFWGFRLQLLIHQNGVPCALGLTTGGAHDSTYLQYLTEDPISNCEVLADKGYLNSKMQQTLFQVAQIKLITPLRNNMKQALSLWSKRFAYYRKRIETLFSQLCDQFMLKRNYAKTTDGLFTRILTKITAATCMQLLNYQQDKPLNKLKHALKS